MLSQIQQAAVGYRGAEYLAEKNDGRVDYRESGSLQQLYGMYTNAYGSYAFDRALREADAGECTGIDAAGAAIQGAVWLAENTRGHNLGTEESTLEGMFKMYADTYGDYNVARELQGRLDPVAYDAIRNYSWWKW